MSVRLVRKRNGRSYTAKKTTVIPRGWFLQDEKGNEYQTYEEYEKATTKPVAKKTTTKKE